MDAPSAAAAAEPSPQPHSGRTLTDAEKLQLYRQGFVIVRNAVPESVIARAHDRIQGELELRRQAAEDKGADKESSLKAGFGENPKFAKGKSIVPTELSPRARRSPSVWRHPPGSQAGLAAAPELLDLIKDSSLTPILTELLGHANRHTEEGGLQPAIRPVQDKMPGQDAPPAGELAPVTSFAGGLHVDGRRPNANEDGFLFVDAAETMAIRPFQCIAFVACSDQTQPGQGQTHVLPGAHLAMEEFFRWQQENFGRLGSKELEDGSPAPGWGGPQGQGIPTAVKETILALGDEANTVVEDGERKLRPVPVLLRPGDACIAAFHLPHTATLNQTGPEREQVILRFGLEGSGNGLNLEDAEVESWRQQLQHQWTGFPGLADIVEREETQSAKVRGLREALRRRLEEYELDN